MDMLRDQLPEGIIDIDLQVNFMLDQFDLMVCVKGEGIYKHVISRSFLENNFHRDIFHHIHHLVMSHVPCAASMQAGAEEYEDILQAQEIMAKISPQS